MYHQVNLEDDIVGSNDHTFSVLMGAWISSLRFFFFFFSWAICVVVSLHLADIASIDMLIICALLIAGQPGGYQTCQQEENRADQTSFAGTQTCECR